MTDTVTVVTNPSTDIVEVVSVGPQGPQGPQGVKGDVGDVNPEMLTLRDAAAASASAAAGSASSASSSASTATTQASAAAASASTATSQATIATNQATTATTKAGEASTSATNAAASASAAASSATTATTQAATATNAASTASGSATTATNQATIATTKASEADASAIAAGVSASNASTSASTAGSHATNAANSASTASSAAATATTQAGIATTKASEASASAITATNSATTAVANAATADTKATEASVSAAAALASQNAAAVSASSSANGAATSTAKASEAAASAAAISAVYGDAVSIQTAVQTAQSQASLAQGYALSASSVVQQDLSGITAQALHRSPNAITGMAIYDTSKDSDGGAWTEKCQHTSWWNEPLAGKWLGPQANEFDARNTNSSLGSEILTNSTFDSNITGWTAGLNTTSSWDSGRLKTTNNGTVFGYTFQSFTTVVGKTYRASASIEVGTAGTVYFRGGTTQAGLTLFDKITSSNGVLTAYFVATSTTTFVHVLNTNISNAHSFADNISVREVTALNTASNDYFQLTTDGKFYRLWKNLLFYSNEFSNAYWTKQTVTFGANGDAPDGTNTAALLVPTSTPNVQQLLRLNIVASSTCAMSIYAKAGGINTFEILDGASGVNGGVFNLSTGVATNKGTGIANMTPVGNGWYRCVAVATTTGFRLYTPNSTGTAAGDGTSGIYIWGAQVELGSAATTYEAKTGQGTTTEIFRGNKADFPRLAGIVAEAGNVNIYDLTEPGRPMWMRLSSGGAGAGDAFLSGTVTYTKNAVAALNGELIIGQTAPSAFGLVRVIFPLDAAYAYSNAANYGGAFKGDISQRNSSRGYPWPGATVAAVVSTTVNAVAMTVLPDAPIDPATGLRVPTIAVGTAAGTSVIKHNGTVVNSAWTLGVGSVGFIGRTLVMNRNEANSVCHTFNDVGNLPPSFTHSLQFHAATSIPRQSDTTIRMTVSPERIALGRALSSSGGISQIRPDRNILTRALISEIRSNYNTGWMTGDIRRAYLSDVDVGSIAAETVFADDFSTYADSAALNAAWTPLNNGILTLSSGRMRVANGASGRSAASISFATTVGRNYTLVLDAISGNTPDVFVYLGTSVGTANIAAVANLNGLGLSLTFVAATTTTFLSLYPSTTGSGLYVEFDNITVRSAVADRSYKQRGAIANGTLTKAQLASGTSLVGYSGFSASNYLREPYSADLDFGTGEWNASAWVNVPVTLPDASFPLGSEIIANGNFASGNTSWVRNLPSWDAASGAMVNDGTNVVNANVRQDSVVVAGRTYKITFDFARTSGSINLWLNGTQLITSGVTVAGPKSYTVVASVTGSVFFEATPGAALSIDNVSVKEVGPAIIADRAHSSGPRIRLGVTGTGLLTAEAYDGTTTRTVTTTAAYNTATWLKVEACYTTDGSLDLVVNGREVAATRGTPLLSLSSKYNLLTYTEQFDNAAWVKGGLTVSANAVASPVGDTTADKVIGTAATGNHTAYQSFTPLASATYTVSCYFKAAEYSKCVINEVGGGRFGAWWDLATGTFTSSTGTGYVSQSITSVGDGWYRCTVTVTSNSSATAFAVCVGGFPTGATPTASSISYTGDGTSGVYVWGAQIELGSSATAYQRVAATAETNVAPLTIGNSYALDAPFPGSIALLKLGATVPTSEQAAFMYEQEKQLFRANAQSVLPDTGAIVDMAYDDATDRWVAVSATNESYWTGLVRNSVTPSPAGSYTKVQAGSGLELVARSTTNPGVDVTIPAYGLREELVKRAEAAARLSKELAVYDYVGGFTANTTNGSTAIASVAGLSYPTSYIGARVSGSGIPANATIVAVSGTTIYLSAAATATATGVNITFLDFRLPPGMEAKAVMSAGALKQEGSTKDYTRLYDGFVETIRFGAAPGVTAWVQITAQRITLQ